MNKEVVILIAEDNEGHFVLARKYLQGRGVRNEIKWFADGKETVDFFFDESFLLLLLVVCFSCDSSNSRRISFDFLITELGIPAIFATCIPKLCSLPPRINFRRKITFLPTSFTETL